MFGYTLHDKKAGTFSPPMFFQHDVIAIRAVQQSAADPKTQLARYPEDFALVCLCEFKEDTGELLPFNPKKVAEVLSLVERTKP